MCILPAVSSGALKFYSFQRDGISDYMTFSATAGQNAIENGSSSAPVKKINTLYYNTASFSKTGRQSEMEVTEIILVKVSRHCPSIRS
jgi:hypothetical protein